MVGEDDLLKGVVELDSLLDLEAAVTGVEDKGIAGGNGCVTLKYKY